MAPGYYQYPYSFTLPNNIPSSFEEVKGKHDYAKIKYETKVKFETRDGFKMKDEDDVFVIQVYPSDLRHQQYKKKFDINCCCCIGRGDVEVAAAFNKTIYHPGETSQFTMWADADDSKVSIKQINGDCTRYVTVKCKGHSRTWKSVVDRVKYPKLEKGDKIGPLNMCPVIRVQNHEMSTVGSMIKCDYKLRAVCDMDKCCQTNPNISLPILICHYPRFPQNTYIKPYHPPPNYNPQIMQPVVYNLNGNNGINNANSYPNYYNQMQAQMNQDPNYQAGNQMAPPPHPQQQGGMAMTPNPNVNVNAQAQGQANQQAPESALMIANLLMKPINPVSELNLDYPNANESGYSQAQQGETGANYEQREFSDDSSDEEMGGGAL